MHFLSIGFFRKKTELSQLGMFLIVINAAKHDCITRCRLAGVSDVVVADARYHLKCYIQFTRKPDCEKKTRKGSHPKDMCMHKVAHKVSIGVIKFVPQLGPHEPQLLFPVVPAKVVVQTLNETKDELEDVVSEQGLHTCLSGQTDEDADDTTRRLSLSFGQDTMHAISKD